MSDRERQIRDLAHQIWEEAGRPTGEDALHWAEAERRYAWEKRAAVKQQRRAAKRRAGKATTLPQPDTAAVPKTAEAPKPKAKAERGAAKAEPAKAKGRGKAKI